jgi:hypothetical protein
MINYIKTLANAYILWYNGSRNPLLIHDYNVMIIEKTRRSVCDERN